MTRRPSTRSRRSKLLDARPHGFDPVEAMAEQVARFGRWSLDARTLTFKWSPGMSNVYGRSVPDDSTLPFAEQLEFHHPDDRIGTADFLHRIIAGEITGPEGCFSRDGRLVLPDGRIRDIAMHGYRTCDAQGATVSLDGMTIDVTDFARSERLLEETASLLRSTLENIDQGLVSAGPDLRVRLHNRRANELFRLPDDVLFDGARLADISAYMSARGDYAGSENRLQMLIDAGPQHVPLFYEREAPDGSVLEIRRKHQPDGGFVHTFADVTRRSLADRELQESERRFRLLAENTNDVIILSGLDLRRLYVSPVVRRMLGYEPEEFARMSVADSIHPEDAGTLAELRADTSRLHKEHYVASMRHRHKEGHWVWCESSLRVVHDPQSGRPVHFVSALRDVTARTEAEERIRHMALHDPLTDLPNRSLFHERLAESLEAAERDGHPCAVLACDLDHFKAVNDTLGHAAGDALLRIVVGRIRSQLRKGDTFARLGGDEFAIVLCDFQDEAAVVSIAERLIEAVGDPVALNGHHVGIGASIGIATTVKGIDADELFKRADIALYQAKAAGRNVVRLFEPGAQTIRVSRGQLALDMKDAVRRGDFRLVYQPVIDLETRSVASFEALMRWLHPSRGEISPVDFIPIAEETGMIVPLGIWALKEACHEACKWPPQIKVAVNVSAAQFGREGLGLHVVSALGASGLPPQRLKLEVTESVLMQDSEAVIAVLHRLRGLGVRIALDDFGAGYSSLRYLRRFPFDKIKIDGSFIREIADPDAAAIVRAIVGIGERLGIGITAEGVETADQLDRVRNEGCTEVQGFFFSPPLEAAAARAYAENFDVAQNRSGQVDRGYAPPFRARA